ncbi:MAG: hypothetical protein O7E56_11275 [SAR324 cluster bacterium]|nr:hypothetical protein [SAR324 cluster bacterium]
MGAFTGIGITSGGNNYAAFFDENGNIRISAGNFKDSGTFELTADNKICLQTKKRGKRCATWWKKGDKIRSIREDHSLSSEFTVKSGNSENL